MRDRVPDADVLQEILDEIVDEVRHRTPRILEDAREAAEARGEAEPDPAGFERFGIAVLTRRGDLVSAGDAAEPFPIQSISKVFALEVALDAFNDEVWHRVGREPSGDPFNSIIDLERQHGIPRNPFINSGALVICDMLVGINGETPADRHVERLVANLLDGRTPPANDEVMQSDREGGDLNRSLMFMAKHHGNLHHPIDRVMDAYVRQCALSLDCRDLAQAGRFLMHDDTWLDESERGGAAARRARRILTVMTTCGLYDGSGDFAYRVGLPAKSGVGGGILATAPHRASIAVFSPALDPMGNSWLGVLGLEALTHRLDWSIYGAVNG